MLLRFASLLRSEGFGSWARGIKSVRLGVGPPVPKGVCSRTAWAVRFFRPRFREIFFWTRIRSILPVG